MSSIIDMFPGITAKLKQGSKQSEQVTPDTVYQVANLENRELVNQVIKIFQMPGSRFENLEALLELGELSRQGKSCLILMEHYSNFDIPNLYYLLENTSPQAAQVINQVISMAGFKLNEESEFARAFTEAFGRIVIYPPRSLNNLRSNTDPSALSEIKRARAINMAALHHMVRQKHAGHIILVFPAGTRYRPGDEDTRRGLREMDSYIKSFDHMLLVGIAGNTLPINMGGAQMGDDAPVKDVVVYVASQVTNAHDFRNSVQVPVGADSKQAVADEVMVQLSILHTQAEAARQKILSGT